MANKADSHSIPEREARAGKTTRVRETEKPAGEKAVEGG